MQQVLISNSEYDYIKITVITISNDKMRLIDKDKMRLIDRDKREYSPTGV